MGLHSVGGSAVGLWTSPKCACLLPQSSVYGAPGKSCENAEFFADGKHQHLGLNMNEIYLLRFATK